MADTRASTIDRDEQDKATRLAASSGVPQPVKNRAGAVVYYVDGTGAVVPQAIAQDAQQRAADDKSKADDQRSGVARDLHGQAHKVNKDGSRLTPAQEAAAAKANSALMTGKQQMGYVWVDGKQLQITGVNDDGSYNATIGGSAEHKFSDFFGATAYGALDATQVPDDTRFTMSYGPGDIFTGNAAAGTTPGMGQTGGQVYGPGDHSRSANQVSNAQNMMTVANGLTWLANLSMKDPKAYGAMVDKLHKAGYLTDTAYAQAGGMYSSLVGNAFATAAADTAVINAQPDGWHTTLDQYLDSRAAGNDAQAGASYTPVNRSYTDPKEITAAAHSAAETALGRRLTKAEEAELVSHFHSLEDAAYNQIDAAKGKGGATYTTPSESGQVAEFVENGPLEQEHADWNMARYGDALKSLFGVK